MLLSYCYLNHLANSVFARILSCLNALPVKIAMLGNISRHDATSKGYTQLSTLIGPYTGIAIYRKFAELNAQNLAYMQVEILIMEADLNSIAKLNAQSGTAEKLFPKEV